MQGLKVCVNPVYSYSPLWIIPTRESGQYRNTTFPLILPRETNPISRNLESLLCSRLSPNTKYDPSGTVMFLSARIKENSGIGSLVLVVVGRYFSFNFSPSM